MISPKIKDALYVAFDRIALIFAVLFGLFLLWIIGNLFGWIAMLVIIGVFVVVGIFKTLIYLFVRD